MSDWFDFTSQDAPSLATPPAEPLWTFSPSPAPPLEPLPPTPAECLVAMEEEAEEPGFDKTLGDPILPCQQPFLEVTLEDSEHSPEALANCRLDLPEGAKAADTLDTNGYRKFENLETDVNNVMLQVKAEPKDTSYKYTVEVVPLAEPKPEPDEEEEEEPDEGIEYFPAQRLVP